MKTDIPIIITFNGQKAPPFPIQPGSIAHPCKARPRTLPTHPIPTHSTHSLGPLAAPPRRMSSSAAARRFPKDFFKDDRCLQPARGKPPRSHNPSSNLTDPHPYRQPFHRHHLATEPNCEKGVETPNFRETATCKTKISDYLSQKRVGSFETNPGGRKDGLKELQVVNFISNVNLTLGQKVNLGHWLKGKAVVGAEKENGSK